MIRVDVIVMPIELEVVYVTQHPPCAIGQNRFYRHRPAPQMHMRLEILDSPCPFHYLDSLMYGLRIWRDVQAPGASVKGMKKTEDLPILRYFTLWIKINREFYGGRDLLTHGMMVDVPYDLRAGEHQLAAVRTHQFTLFPLQPTP